MKAWISGYYGRENVGDEAILEAVLKHLPKGIQPFVITANIQNTRRIHNVSAMLDPPLNYKTGRHDFWFGFGYWIKYLPRVLPYLLVEKPLIVAGGGCLNDKVAGRVAERLVWVRAKKKINCRIAFLGIGVDPMTCETDCSAANILLKNEIDYCSVRDNDSAKALVELGVPKSAFHVAADLVFSLIDFYENVRLKESALSKSSIALNLRPLFDKVRERDNKREIRLERYRNSCAELVQALVQKVGRLEFLSLNQEDRDFMESLGSKADIKIVDPGSSPMAVIKYLQNMDGIIGMRFHSIILGMLIGLSCVPIPYACKGMTLANDLGFDPVSLCVGDGTITPDHSLDVDEIISSLENVWNDREAHRRVINKLCAERSEIAKKDMHRCWEKMGII